MIPLVSNAPKYPVFVSESGQRNRNKWGSLRGYKIQTHPWPYHLLPPDEGYGRALGARGVTGWTAGAARGHVGMQGAVRALASAWSLLLPTCGASSLQPWPLTRAPFTPACRRLRQLCVCRDRAPRE